MTTLVSSVRRLKSQPYELILGTLALLGLFYVLPKGFAIYDPDVSLDFRVIWLAGKVWASGQNPYGPVFIRQYLDIFGPGWDFYWPYPPNWYPLSVLFGLLPFRMSNVAWSVFNFSLLIAATHLVARALADVSGRKYLRIFFAGLAYVCFMQATAITVYIGQTSILIYFGLSAIIFGLLKDRPLMLIVGLVFVALKPQIGVVAIAAVAALARYRWTLLPTAGIGLLSMAPILIKGDLRATLEGLLGNLAQYSSASPVQNSPANLTGLINILDYSSTSSIQPFIVTIVLILTTIIGAFVVFLFSPLNEAPEPGNARRQVASLALFVAGMFFIIPLHPYDHTALAALLMMILAFRFSGRWLMAIGLLICIRPKNLYSVLGFAHPGSEGFRESLLMSAGLLLILLGVIWSLLYQPAESPTFEGTPNSAAK